MPKKRVLFISAPIGSGHLRAAQAVGRVLGNKTAQIEIEFANVFDFFHPLLGKAILKFYLKILQVFPDLYAGAYNWGNNSRQALFFRNIISKYLAKRMYTYIERIEPAAIVCTHATPAGLVAYLVRKKQITVPAFAIITDFVVHRMWVHEGFTQYFVAHDEMRNYLYCHGVEFNNSQVCGIPVDQKFTMWTDRKNTLKKLKLYGNIKTILVMGGGSGVLPMDEIVSLCDRMEMPLQILAVTGNNISIYTKLKKMQPMLRSYLHIYHYVDNVHEMMAVADILISKPGGMTSAEALCMGLPMLIYRPIPGQEEANTDYLIQQQVAIRADSLSQLTTILQQLLKEPQQLLQLSQKAKALGMTNAASRIADFIISKIEA